MMKKSKSKKCEVKVGIGKAIQFWRKLEGHDQKSLANKLKVVTSYVSRIEAGFSSISVMRINEICDFLGVSLFTLLRGVPEKDEMEILLELYKNAEYEITKEELEDLFCARLKGHKLTREFYLNQLSVMRSEVFI